MKNPKEQAKRWLKQAEYDLNEAKKSLKDGSYAYTCFFAEQSAQKSLKAVLYLDGARFINIHSIRELVKELSKKRTEFLELSEKGTLLDQYYLSSRYPDAVPEPAVPSEIFIKGQADMAVDIAGRIYKKAAESIQI